MALDSLLQRPLEHATVLLMSPSEHSLSILVQIVTTLGGKRLYRCDSLDQAREIAGSQAVSLAILDVFPPATDIYEFVRWMRRNTAKPTCQAPILLTATDTSSADAQEVVNCGADAVVKKPIVPKRLMERIQWAVRPERQLVVSETYVGPERRPPERLAAETAAAAKVDES